MIRSFREHFDQLDREQFVVVLLDQKNKPLAFTSSRQERSARRSSIREVFKAAVLASAAGIVALHNHPSGDPAPSAEDHTITGRLVAAGQLLGIPVLDHIVVGDEGHFSFADAGLLHA